MLKIIYAEGVEPTRKLQERARNEGLRITVRANAEQQKRYGRPIECFIAEDRSMLFVWKNDELPPTLCTKYQGKL